MCATMRVEGLENSRNLSFLMKGQILEGGMRMKLLQEQKEALEVALEQYGQLRIWLGDFFPSMPRFKKRAWLATVRDTVLLPVLTVVTGILIPWSQISTWGTDTEGMIQVGYIVLAVLTEVRWFLGLYVNQSGDGEVFLPFGYHRAIKVVLREIQNLSVRTSEMEKDVFRSKLLIRELQEDVERVAGSLHLKIEAEVYYRDEVRMRLRLEDDSARLDISVTASGYNETEEWLGTLKRIGDKKEDSQKEESLG